uniref:Protein kinase domain-containing protein n=1 Tax=Pyxicephalus adspersus TaxID=30357 RepID=A0AAV3AWT0_PYXAD|nr:TPA: hypothetical protein GDO54_001105 [Pyxicephalus adspersus]
MSRLNIVLPPYPVQLGSIKHDSCEKQLHEYVKAGNYAKAKQILKKGILPDSINSHGQTPLFVAALLGLQKIVDLLLEYGSSPNHRCFDWSTPVHAAAFSCNQWIMSKLIDSGGDLRLHDEKSRRPFDWALMAGQDQYVQMLEFIDHCSAHVHVLIHGFDCKHKNVVTSQEFIKSPSSTGLLLSRNVDKSLSKEHENKKKLLKRIHSFGYGELYVGDSIQVGFIASVPLIHDVSIVQDDHKPAFCFTAGPYMRMTNLMWGCTEVTVKGPKVMTHESCSKERFADLLIEELKNISNLHHPLILHLLAVSTSFTLERIQLVFEKVAFGSLYNILHERRSEFVLMHMETLVNTLLQAIDALMFLHWRGFIHCSFSSHAIQLVSTGQAKISNFEYMIQSIDDRTNSDVAYFPIPDQLYRWSSPEIVLRKSVTVKSDLYSFCAVMQECLTDCLPWDGFDGPAIKHAMVSGHYLDVDPRLFKPFDTIARTGLQAKPKKRTMNLQDIKYLIKNEFRDAVDGPTHVSRKVNTRTGSIQHTEQQYPADVLEGVSEPTYKTSLFENDSTEKNSLESQTDTMYEVPEEANALHCDIRLLDNNDCVSSSASSWKQSVYETSLSSDLEDDTDYESPTQSDTWRRAAERLTDGLTSIVAYHRFTLENLMDIQKFLQTPTIVPLYEETTDQQIRQTENVQIRELSNKCLPHMSTDEVDNKVTHFKSKLYAEWSPVAPPQLSYVPPHIPSSSRNAFDEEQIDPTRIQSDCFGGTRRKTVQMNNYCNADSKFKRNIHQNPVTTQINTCITSNISGSCISDDSGLVKKQFNSKRSSTQELEKVSHGGHRKTPDWTRTEYVKFAEFVQARTTSRQGVGSSEADKQSPSPVDEQCCATFKGINTGWDHLKDIDDSSETSYFTPESEMSAENSQEKSLSTDSNNSIGEDMAEQSSLQHGGSSIINKTQERNQIVCSTRDKTFEKDMTKATTLSLSLDLGSIIDVEGLSTIFSELKSPTKHFTPTKTMEASARHSTPINQGTCSKISSVPQQKSPETTGWASIESHKSTKSSVKFLTAEQLQEETTDVTDTPIKNQGLVCIVGSGENSDANNLYNKTDCECQSMDITSLLTETEKTSDCDSMKLNLEDNNANKDTPDAVE